MWTESNGTIVTTAVKIESMYYSQSWNCEEMFSAWEILYIVFPCFDRNEFSFIFQAPTY